MTVPRTKTGVRALLGANGIYPAKRRGQNFLVDGNLIDFIVRTAAPIGAADTILEVGTGTGILTDALADTGARVFSCDLDRHMQEITRGLRDWPATVTFLDEDVLSGKHSLNERVIEPWRMAGGRLRVIANLPYAVATPVLANLLWSGLPVADMLVLVQKEAAQRFTAPPGGKDYGPIAIAVALLAEARIVRDVSPQVFWPQPNVTSALLHLRLRDPARARELSELELPALLKTGFLHRRKSLRKRLDPARLEAAGIDPAKRPQDVEPEAWVRLLTVPPA